MPENPNPPHKAPFWNLVFAVYILLSIAAFYLGLWSYFIAAMLKREDPFLLAGPALFTIMPAVLLAALIRRN